MTHPPSSSTTTYKYRKYTWILYVLCTGNALDINVWDKEYLVTVFNKVAHF